jgi:photosystem II stability/assembly factor-like uncharacterized protein
MHTGTTSNLLGIDVVNRDVVWASGAGPEVDPSSSPGVVVRTVDGGQSWQDVTPPGGQAMAFHDVKAFDRDRALALSVGFGEASKIFRTIDGGANWELRFENKDPDAFYDGIAIFDENRAIALSDPVNPAKGKFRILATVNGGDTWDVVPTAGMPEALNHEVARATGRCLITTGRLTALFGTQTRGPGDSRVFRTGDGGLSWDVAPIPIPGNPEFGVASLAFWDAQHGLALGGGGPHPEKPSVVARTADGGASWAAVGSPSGFRINIAVVATNLMDTAVAVGFTGSDITTDGGKTWRRFDQTDLRGIDCADGSCWAVGKGGRAARL